MRDPLWFLRLRPGGSVCSRSPWCSLDHETMNSDARTVGIAIACVALAVGAGILVWHTARIWRARAGTS